MAESIFDKFDQQIDKKALEDARKEAGNNAASNMEAPKGVYVATIEKMEIRETKSEPKRPMFSVQMRLVSGEDTAARDYLVHFKNKKPCVFMNRVMFGTKNDARMIASVEGWLNDLGFEDPFVFTTFKQFNEDILDAAEELDGEEFEIEYDPDAFNSIHIC